MTTDDLRTRAREAAEGRCKAAGYPVDGPIANLLHTPTAVGAFEEGAIWAHEQLPGREEIAREVAYWAPTWDDAGSIADVVLALIHGAES